MALPVVEHAEANRLVTRTDRATAAQLVHSYRAYRDDLLLAEGKSTITCVDASGDIRRMPECLVHHKEVEQK